MTTLSTEGTELSSVGDRVVLRGGQSCPPWGTVIPSHVAIQAEESPDEDGKIRALSETGLDVTERPLKVKDENE
jgi:hypothetical protein